MRQSSVKHNPLTFYLRLLLYMFVALLIRLIVLAPLAALYVFPQGSPWRWLAALCPALMLFFILPQRFSFAEALVQKPRERFFSFDQALSMKGYGRKLLESLLHALNLLKWALPLIAMGGYALYCSERVDAKTLMMALINTGKTVSNLLYGISSFFVSLLGHLPSPQVAGGLMEGVYVLLAVVGVGVVVLLIGAVRNSATRYIWVLAEREERPVRTEVRRRLRGRRWRQMGVGLCNLLLLAPFLVTVALSLKNVLGDLSTQVMLLMAGGGKGSALPLTDALMPLLTAFLLLYMPLLPARRILTAAFATHNARHAVPKQPEVTHEQNTSAAYVPDWVKETNAASAPEQAPAVLSSFAERTEAAVAPAAAAAQAAEVVADKPVENAPIAETPVADEPIDRDFFTQPEPIHAAEAYAETPVVDETVADMPVADEPVAETPVADEPADSSFFTQPEPIQAEAFADKTVAEEPIAETHVANEPIAAEPVSTDEPATETPIADEPSDPVFGASSEPEQTDDSPLFTFPEDEGSEQRPYHDDTPGLGF